jgi:integrase
MRTRRAGAQTVEGRLAVGDVLDLGEARRTTLGESLERYLAEVTPLKKGAKQEPVRIRAWLRDPLARRALASIRSMEVAAWRNERVAAGKAPTTIRNALTIISQVFQVAGTEWGMQGLQNPVRGVRMPRSRPARDRRLEPGEEERILAGCDAAGQPVLRPIVIWAIETAMRQGEILSLEARCIRGNVAYLRGTKTTRARSVPLSTRALRVLDERPVPLRGRCLRSRRTALSISGARRCGSPGLQACAFTTCGTRPPRACSSAASTAWKS